MRTNIYSDKDFLVACLTSHKKWRCSILLAGHHRNVSYFSSEMGVRVKSRKVKLVVPGIKIGATLLNIRRVGPTFRRLSEQFLELERLGKAG